MYTQLQCSTVYTVDYVIDDLLNFNLNELINLHNASLDPRLSLGGQNDLGSRLYACRFSEHMHKLPHSSFTLGKEGINGKDILCSLVYSGSIDC